MSDTPFKIILLRHAESEKNIKKIHGGQGEALTERGVGQAVAFAHRLADLLNIGELKLLASTSFHTRRTAEIIASELGLPVEKPLDFRPLYLGVADGLSEGEMKERYPREQELFVRWRHREIDIKALTVPEMEPYMDFWRRGEGLVDALPRGAHSVLVCSNSLMILLANLLRGNHPHTTDNYRHLDIGNCEAIAFETTDFESFSLNPDITSVRLPEENW